MPKKDKRTKQSRRVHVPKIGLKQDYQVPTTHNAQNRHNQNLALYRAYAYVSHVFLAVVPDTQVSGSAMLPFYQSLCLTRNYVYAYLRQIVAW